MISSLIPLLNGLQPSFYLKWEKDNFKKPDSILIIW